MSEIVKNIKLFNRYAVWYNRVVMKAAERRAGWIDLKSYGDHS